MHYCTSKTYHGITFEEENFHGYKVKPSYSWSRHVSRKDDLCICTYAGKRLQMAKNSKSFILECLATYVQGQHDNVLVHKSILSYTNHMTILNTTV